MKIKQRTLIYATLPLCFLFILPITLDILFPVGLLLFLKLACLALLPVLILLIFKKRSTYLIPVRSEARMLPLFPWLISMLIIMTCVSALFFGQLCTLSQYMVQNNQMSIPLLMPWLLKTFNFVFLNPALFPWSFLALCILIYFAKQEAYTSSLFIASSQDDQITTKVWRRALDISISSSLFLLLFSSTAFCVIQISVFLSPLLNTFMHPFVSMLLCGLLIFLLVSNRAKNLLSLLEKRQWSISTILSIFIILCCLLGALASKLVLSFFPQLLQQFDWQPTHFISQRYFLFFLEIWSTAWWIVLMPFLGSLIMRISAGRSIFTVIGTLLLIPILAFHIAPNIPQRLIPLFFSPSYMIIIQLLAVALLFTLFASKKGYDWIRLGYIPAEPLKKHRRLELLPVLLSSLGLLSSIAFLGISALQILYAILAFNILMSLFFLIVKSILRSSSNK